MPHDAAGAVEMLVVSTRALSPDPATIYTEGRGETTALLLDVSVPRAHVKGQVEMPNQGAPDPQRHFSVVQSRPATQDTAVGWTQQWGPQADLMLYVHGFNNSFPETVFSLAQLVHDAEIPLAPVLFAWPSAGRTTGYLYDRESANYSRDSLEHALELITGRPEVRGVTVVAHSMGTWLAMEALRQFAIRRGRVDAKIKDVVLVSPDLDMEVFRTQLSALGADRPHITITVSRDDRALELSRRLAGGFRLGLLDPNEAPVRSFIESTAGVTVIDLQSVKAGDRSNHNKLAASAPVVKLIGSHLAAGHSVEEEQLPLLVDLTRSGVRSLRARPSRILFVRPSLATSN